MEVKPQTRKQFRIKLLKLLSKLPKQIAHESLRIFDLDLPDGHGFEDNFELPRIFLRIVLERLAETIAPWDWLKMDSQRTVTYLKLKWSSQKKQADGVLIDTLGEEK